MIIIFCIAIVVSLLVKILFKPNFTKSLKLFSLSAGGSLGLALSMLLLYLVTDSEFHSGMYDKSRNKTILSETTIVSDSIIRCLPNSAFDEYTKIKSTGGTSRFMTLELKGGHANTNILSWPFRIEIPTETLAVVEDLRILKH